MTKEKKLISNITGWIGMLFIQSSTLPVTYKVLMGESTHIPPMNMVALVWIGIVFYLIRAIIQRDIVHITSNVIGFITQSLLLSLIVFK